MPNVYLGRFLETVINAFQKVIIKRLKLRHDAVGILVHGAKCRHWGAVEFAPPVSSGCFEPHAGNPKLHDACIGVAIHGYFAIGPGALGQPIHSKSTVLGLLKVKQLPAVA